MLVLVAHIDLIASEKVSEVRGLLKGIEMEGDPWLNKATSWKQ